MMNSNTQTTITKEDVIAKLKDDGDFDKLRIAIIRKLKDNEELRNYIISEVKQSAALNRAGAENMKPRQLSDAINEEIGSKVTSEISEALWGIIRSEDGMKTEIVQTVESVYNELVNPRGNESSSHDPVAIETDINGNGLIVGQEQIIVSPTRNDMSNGKESEVEGYNVVELENVDSCDEDPDIPPGFG